MLRVVILLAFGFQKVVHVPRGHLPRKAGSDAQLLLQLFLQKNHAVSALFALAGSAALNLDLLAFVQGKKRVHDVNPSNLVHPGVVAEEVSAAPEHRRCEGGLSPSGRLLDHILLLVVALIFRQDIFVRYLLKVGRSLICLETGRICKQDNDGTLLFGFGNHLIRDGHPVLIPRRCDGDRIPDLLVEELEIAQTIYRRHVGVCVDAVPVHDVPLLITQRSDRT
mmetsp:Transcript_6740/g.25313  ORF Transcript_6740/g.25313 Transcript_6740/m.25313 type:complete len:223 (+) Transcript_6740:1299-1967(+)